MAGHARARYFLRMPGTSWRRCGGGCKEGGGGVGLHTRSSGQALSCSAPTQRTSSQSTRGRPNGCRKATPH
eukprot:354731-Chlamydomonas_euryale.AAC.9